MHPASGWARPVKHHTRFPATLNSPRNYGFYGHVDQLWLKVPNTWTSQPCTRLVSPSYTPAIQLSCAF